MNKRGVIKALPVLIILVLLSAYIYRRYYLLKLFHSLEKFFDDLEESGTCKKLINVLTYNSCRRYLQINLPG